MDLKLQDGVLRLLDPLSRVPYDSLDKLNLFDDRHLIVERHLSRGTFIADIDFQLLVECNSFLIMHFNLSLHSINPSLQYVDGVLDELIFVIFIRGVIVACRLLLLLDALVVEERVEGRALAVVAWWTIASEWHLSVHVIVHPGSHDNLCPALSCLGSAVGGTKECLSIRRPVARN